MADGDYERTERRAEQLKRMQRIINARRKTLPTATTNKPTKNISPNAN